MFSAVNHFHMLKAGRVSGRRAALQIHTREPIKEIIRTASNFTTRPQLEMTKDVMHIKNMQSNKINIIKHKA